MVPHTNTEGLTWCANHSSLFLLSWSCDYRLCIFGHVSVLDPSSLSLLPFIVHMWLCAYYMYIFHPGFSVHVYTSLKIILSTQLNWCVVQISHFNNVRKETLSIFWRWYCCSSVGCTDFQVEHHGFTRHQNQSGALEKRRSCCKKGLVTVILTGLLHRVGASVDFCYCNLEGCEGSLCMDCPSISCLLHPTSAHIYCCPLYIFFMSTPDTNCTILQGKTPEGGKYHNTEWLLLCDVECI